MLHGNFLGIFLTICHGNLMEVLLMLCMPTTLTPKARLLFLGSGALTFGMNENDQTPNDVVINVQGSCVFWYFNDLTLRPCGVVEVEVKYLHVGFP